MRNRFYLLTFFIILSLFIFLLSSCSAPSKSQFKEIQFNNGAAIMEYDSSKWSETEVKNMGNMLHIKSESKAVLIGAGRVPSELSLEDYVSEYKKSLQAISVDNFVEEEEFNNYPLLRYKTKAGDATAFFTVVIIKDGDGYYESCYICIEELYEKYKDEALSVLATFQIVNTSMQANSNESYTENNELYQLLEKAKTGEIIENEAIDESEIEAIKFFQKMLMAYNNKEINELRRIVTFEKGITDNDILTKISSANNYIHHYVGMTSADGSSMTGRFLYSYETKSENDLVANKNLAMTCFVLKKEDGEWILAAGDTYNPQLKDMERLSYMFELQEKSKEKYGTDNLMNIE